MRKLSVLFCVLLCAFSGACGGGSGAGTTNSSASNNTPLGVQPHPSSGSSCSFSFSSISNGASAKLADSYWACTESDGQSQGTYNFVFFDDGSGGSTVIGAFTWSETACAQAEANTTQGKVEVSNITGSKSIQAVTFDLSYESGLHTHATCALNSFAEVPSNEAAATPPDSAPSSSAPSGSGSNEAVLSSPAYAGVLYSVFAQDGQFLGLINSNPFDPNSLCNAFGTYGNKFSSLSIWDQFGSYGSNFATYSAFNNVTSTPPVIFANNTPLAYLTTNSILAPRLDSNYLLGLLQAAGCNVSR